MRVKIKKFRYGSFCRLPTYETTFPSHLEIGTIFDLPHQHEEGKKSGRFFSSQRFFGRGRAKLKSSLVLKNECHLETAQTSTPLVMFTMTLHISQQFV